MNVYKVFREEDFSVLSIIDYATSVTFEEVYCGIGTFDIYLPYRPALLEFLTENAMVELEHSRGIYGVITQISKTTSTQGIMGVVLGGKLTARYLNDRIVWATHAETNWTSLIGYNVVEENLTNPANGARLLPNIYLPETRAELGRNIDHQNRGKLLGDELYDLLNPDELGFRMKTDPYAHRHDFEIYAGVDRTVNQTVNPKVIFSTKYRNVLSSEYKHDRENGKTTALIAGEGEGAERVLTTIGDDATGLARKEVFIDARHIRSQKDNGAAIPTAEYIAMLQQCGREKLMGDYQVIQALSGEIFLDGAQQYIRDFALGDKVTFIDTEIGLSLDVRISAARTTYKGASKSVGLTLGYQTPPLDKVILRKAGI